MILRKIAVAMFSNYTDDILLPKTITYTRTWLKGETQSQSNQLITKYMYNEHGNGIICQLNVNRNMQLKLGQDDCVCQAGNRMDLNYSPGQKFCRTSAKKW